MDLDLVGNHSMVEETLDKIREKIIDRTMESDHLLQKYEAMLRETEQQIIQIKDAKREHDKLRKLDTDNIKIDLVVSDKSSTSSMGNSNSTQSVVDEVSREEEEALMRQKGLSA